MSTFVVDSSGWLEYFADGPDAQHFAQATGATVLTQDADFEGLAGVRYWARMAR